MHKTTLLKILLLWLAWAVILVSFQKLVVVRFAPYRPDKVIGWTQTETTLQEIKRQVYLSDTFLNELVAWDSEYYLSIAVKGYDDPTVDYVEAGGEKFTKNYAFFPLFPFTSYFSTEGFFVEPRKKLHITDEGDTVKSALEYGLGLFFLLLLQECCE